MVCKSSAVSAASSGQYLRKGNLSPPAGGSAGSPAASEEQSPAARFQLGILQKSTMPCMQAHSQTTQCTRSCEGTLAALPPLSAVCFTPCLGKEFLHPGCLKEHNPPQLAAICCQEQQLLSCHPEHELSASNGRITFNSSLSPWPYQGLPQRIADGSEIARHAAPNRTHVEVSRAALARLTKRLGTTANFEAMTQSRANMSRGPNRCKAVQSTTRNAALSTPSKSTPRGLTANTPERFTPVQDYMGRETREGFKTNSMFEGARYFLLGIGKWPLG